VFILSGMTQPVSCKPPVFILSGMTQPVSCIVVFLTTPRYRWNTAKDGVKHQLINQTSLIMPRYRWNAANLCVKHQSINHP
jgi:hypothetical protein